MPQSKKPVSQLDTMAQQKGFPNYAAWKAWNEKYRSKKTRTEPAPKKKNFLQSLSDFHPMTWSANRVTETLKKERKK